HHWRPPLERDLGGNKAAEEGANDEADSAQCAVDVADRLVAQAKAAHGARVDKEERAELFDEALAKSVCEHDEQHHPDTFFLKERDPGFLGCLPGSLQTVSLNVGARAL